MRSDEYHRLHAVCLDMAKQSTLPDVQARWQAIADEWLKLATEQRRSGRSAQNTSTASLAITGGVSRIPTCGVYDATACLHAPGRRRKRPPGGVRTALGRTRRPPDGPP